MGIFYSLGRSRGEITEVVVEHHIVALTAALVKNLYQFYLVITLKRSSLSFGTCNYQL